MKLSDEVHLTRLIPTRIRTLMILNVVVALAMVVFLNFATQIGAGANSLVAIAQIVFVLSLLGVVLFAPLVLVEIYLYKRKKGVFFQWTVSPARPPRDVIPKHRIRRYPRTAKAETAHNTRARTQLFESSSVAAPVSRASLLLNVGDELAEAGKKEAAQKCYRQILERFAGTPEAQAASRHLNSPAQGGRLISE
jgi:hypothetical protein